MSERPEPTPQVAAVPATIPFVAPEELARRAGHASLLRLGANESAFGPPPRALEAMREALPHTSWYGDPESAELRAALATRHGCLPDNITVASGIDDILGLAVRSYLAVGDVALTTRGTYPTFAFHVAGFGARLETMPYSGGGSVQLDALVEHANALRPNVVYVANPDNPSGSFRSRGLPATTLLILDEAYADFVPSGDLMMPAVVDRVVRARTFSKAYGLAGARIAYTLAPADVVATFQKIRHHYGVNRTAQVGALAALEDPQFV
jgi:histidinol-phosphate aminotransferase